MKSQFSYEGRPGDYHFRLLKLVRQALEVESLVKGEVLSRSGVDQFRGIMSLLLERLTEWKDNNLSERCGKARRLVVGATDSYVSRVPVYLLLDSITIEGDRQEKASQVLLLIHKVSVFAMCKFARANFHRTIDELELLPQQFIFEVEGSATPLQVFEFFNFCKVLEEGLQLLVIRKGVCHV